MNLVNTTAKVRKQEISVDCAALFDILLIALMMTLLGSKFVAATGLGVSFGGGGESGLPKMGVPDSAVANSDMDVLSARGDSMLIFDGAIYTIDSFRKSFSHAGKQERRGTLLIKADKNLSVQTLVEICEAAKSAGFENAIIAAEPDGRR